MDCIICCLEYTDNFTCVICKNNHCMDCHLKMQKCPFCRAWFSHPHFPNLYINIPEEDYYEIIEIIEINN